MTPLQPIIAELAVESVDASISWYRELGFEVDAEGQRDDDGRQWVSLSHEGRSVWLLRADMFPAATPPEPGAPRMTLYLQVLDVDAVYARLIERRIETEHVPQNQWYGLREFALRDPDGFRWVINQPIPEDQTPPPPRTPPLPG
ncbi:MAG: VOC family protein [Chloroflexota bacterium]